MDILVLAESYSHFEYFIQDKSYMMKLFMKGDTVAEDKNGNKYYFYSPYVDSMHGRCFDKIIDIRLLSIDALSRFRNYAKAEIEIGGITFTHGKRNSKGK